MLGSPLLTKRIKAAFIDYLLIIGYAMLLFLITNSIALRSGIIFSKDPIQGQLTGLFTLTIPVFLYFYYSEKSKWKGTIGKRLQKIHVQSRGETSASNIFLRNLFKLLPWEMAHTGVHWIIYFSTVKTEVPVWVWIILIAPQLTALAYLISILKSKGASSMYDSIAHTKMELSTASV